MAQRITGIHRTAVFADLHAHPSRFHRADIERIEPEEVGKIMGGNFFRVCQQVAGATAEPAAARE